MKGGAHQSLLTLMRTLVCLHKEGVGLAICDKGICFCMGRDLEAEKRKDWDRMEGHYDFEGNRGVVLEIDSGTEISKSNKEVGVQGCLLIYDIPTSCWGGGNLACAGRPLPLPKMATMVPWNASSIISCYPTSAISPLSLHLELPLVLPEYSLLFFVLPPPLIGVLLSPLMVFQLLQCSNLPFLIPK